MSILQLTPHAVAQPQLQIEYGEVAAPAPVSLNDTLYVNFPDWYTGVSFPVSWVEAHGNNLPPVGAACLVIKDSRGTRRCVWWAKTPLGDFLATPEVGVSPDATFDGGGGTAYTINDLVRALKATGIIAS